MNIDNSSLLSLLSPALVSSDESLEAKQQTVMLDVNGSQEFTNTLLETIKQISALEDSEIQVENQTLNLPESTNILHQVAGLLNEKKAVADFSSLFGKELPVVNRLEKDINLENTMEALANVMNTLEGIVLKDVDIGNNLEILVEKVEAIKVNMSEQDAPASDTVAEKIGGITKELEKIGGITKELEKIRDVIVKNNELEVKITDLQDEKDLLVTGEIDQDTKINGNIPKQKDLVEYQFNNEESDGRQNNQVNKLSIPATTETPEKIVSYTEGVVNEEISPVAIKLVKRLDKVVEAVKQIKDLAVEEKSLNQDVDLEDAMKDVIVEIETIKTAITEKYTTQTVEKKADDTLGNIKIGGNQQMGDIDSRQINIADKEDSALPLEKQLAAIVATLNAPQEKEKTTSPPTFYKVNPDNKNEALSLQQMEEQRTLGTRSKAEPETLLQQENTLNKTEQENPVVRTEQNKKTELSDTKELETTQDKSVTKITTAITHLNQSIRLENKLEIPPMTKHFSHPEWNKEIAEKVIWMHKQEIPSAELRLNPRHLGPVTIKVDVTQDQATVAFTVQHAAVKEAIEAALPKLREMFSNQQLNLTEVNVSQEDARQRQSRGFSQMGSDAESKHQKEPDGLADIEQAENSMEIADEIEAGRAIASNGILSIFA